MGEKKEIKVKASTVIFIILIVLLIAGCGALYYFGCVEKDKEIKTLEAEKKQVEAEKTQAEIQNEDLEKQIANAKKEENDKKTNTSVLTEEEIQKILGPDDAYFCIEDIEKSGEDYIITAYMLEKGKRVIYSEELKDGKEIEFRNQKWKLKHDDQLGIDMLQSGEDKLSYIPIAGYNGYRNLVGNIAGSDAILSDYSNQKISFKVSKDIFIGTLWTVFEYDENGKIKISDPEETNYKNLSFQRLQEISEGCRGSYDECKAYVHNGKVDAIKIYYN